MKGSAVVVLTGAGASAESGIRTFRDNDGLWENHRVEDVATPLARGSKIPMSFGVSIRLEGDNSSRSSQIQHTGLWLDWQKEWRT